MTIVCLNPILQGNLLCDVLDWIVDESDGYFVCFNPIVQGDFLCDILDWMVEESNDDMWLKGTKPPQLKIQVISWQIFQIIQKISLISLKLSS
jgi:hypothetical protein